jgi:hypothetical protein
MRTRIKGRQSYRDLPPSSSLPLSYGFKGADPCAEGQEATGSLIESLFHVVWDFVVSS